VAEAKAEGGIFIERCTFDGCCCVSNEVEVMVDSRLRRNDSVPEFDLRVFGGRRCSHEDLVGGWTLLSFHRYASCPVCNLTLQEYRRRYEQLRLLGVEKVAVFHSPVEKLEQYMASDAFPFTILADPDRSAYKAFAVEPRRLSLFKPGTTSAFLKTLGKTWLSTPLSADGPISTCPADFIVGPDTRVLYARYGEHIGDSLSVEELMRVLPKLKMVEDDEENRGIAAE
jgi:peroxiredoxin